MSRSPATFPFSKLTEITRINGVPVYVHWSVLLIAGVFGIGAVQRPAEMLALVSSYFGLILIHECGHMLVAQSKRYRVYAIELYPIHGKCIFEEPYSRYDLSLIAWGGVFAQAVIALPVIVWVSIFGFTRSPAINMCLAVLGYYSLFLAAFNLAPAPFLDGARAWWLFPEWFKRAKVQKDRARKVIEWRR